MGIDKWFDAFPEIRDWTAQVAHAIDADEAGRTLLGRMRPLHGLVHRSTLVRAHARRAATNSPVQGSASDVVMMAMLALRESKQLQQLKFRQVLQVHDEIILEGPQDSVDEALSEV